MEATVTNAGRVVRALRYFRFSEEARLVAAVIIEHTLAAQPERWTVQFVGQQVFLVETSLSKNRVSEAIRELELTKVIVRSRAGRGEFAVTLNPPIDPVDGRVVWSAPRASLRYASDDTLALAIEGRMAIQRFARDVACAVAGQQEFWPVQDVVDKDVAAEIDAPDESEVPPVGTSRTPVSGKDLPESPVSGKPVSGNPVLSGIGKRDCEVPPAGTSSDDELLEFARRTLPSDFIVEHGGLLREFCRESRRALYEAICAYREVRVKPRDLRGWFATVYRQKRDAARENKLRTGVN
jgi:hypothetical protein